MATALYRRYRPESFADVIGQEHVTEPLMQALRTGRVNHAYLFSGPRGCGKTTSARILARCLNCEQGPTPVPCGVCDSCVALARGGSGSVDVIEIDAASHGGVDDARDLRERASYGPASSRYKVYIIDEAHMVTPQGFNALLKIVEEPPEHVKFVFATTEPDKVIGTIRSRTHHYPFRLVPPLRLQDYLETLCAAEGVAVAPGVLSFVVRAGGGSVRDSLSVLDQLIAGSGEEGLTYASAAALLGFTEGELLDATIDALAAGDGAAVFRQIDKVIETGHDPRRYVEDLLERLRDLIVVAAVPDGGSSVLRGVSEDQLERLRQQSGAFGPGALSRAADIVNAGLTEMTGATAPRLQLELICARVLLPGASGPSGYAARLDRLERRLEMGGPSAPREASEPARSGSKVEPRRPDPGAGGPDARPSPRSTFRPTPRSTTPTPGEQAPVPARPSVGPGGADTETIRRAWPDVLAKVFSIRRVTWTFLSEHAKVLDYDGDRLLLGIATVGLANTFRSGQHAELVRQALIEVLGVDARVEGIPTPEAATAKAPSAPSPTSPSGPAEDPATAASTATSTATSTAPTTTDDARRPRRQATGADDRSRARGSAAASQGLRAMAAASAQPEPDDGWNTSAAPPCASAPAASGGAAAELSDPAPGSPQSPRSASPKEAGAATQVSGTVEGRQVSPMVRARAEVAREGRAGNTRSARLTADDSLAGADDEDIEEAGAMGQPVIERVLGGTVIGELEQ